MYVRMGGWVGGGGGVFPFDVRRDKIYFCSTVTKKDEEEGVGGWVDLGWGGRLDRKRRRNK